VRGSSKRGLDEAGREEDGNVSDTGSDFIGVKKRRAAVKDSENEDDDSDKGSAVGELIADIFGPSDEEEEFEGFGADADSQRRKEKKSTEEGEVVDEALLRIPEGGEEAGGSSDDDESRNKKGRDGSGVSDFDIMLAKKKEEAGKRRKKRKDVDIINDNDDLIDAMVKKMKEAAEEDRQLNQEKKPAAKKLKMLPEVISQLKKSDLHHAFLDGGILSAITEWLAPLPDKSLPHLQIREALLKQLILFPQISTEGLKLSGIGKAVMYLCKHPKEIRQNREAAGKLINEWSRPIFNLTSNYKNLSREEREQRDYEQLPKKRRISLEGGASSNQDMDRAMAGSAKVLRPGDPGYVYRARVPMPSTKDYVIRPKWTVEEKPKNASKKVMSKLDKCMRSYSDKKRKQGYQQAVTISVEGRKMAL
jgi:transcription factor SPN1